MRCAVLVGERCVGEVTILDIVGPLTDDDDVNIGLRDTLTRLIQAGCVRLLVNMAQVPSVGSAGLAALAYGYTSATRRGGTLKLAGAAPRVHDLLIITRLQSVFETFDREAEAVASFTKAPPRQTPNR
jgi:anti-sigma B factor antagonist